MFRVVLMVALAAFFGNPPIAEAKAKFEYAQCRSNGKCCKALNRFWDRVAARPEDLSGGMDDSVLRGDKDFLMVYSNKYIWNKKLKCPSLQSEIAEAFKLIYNVSKTKYASTNYYEFVKSTTVDNDFSFMIQDLDDQYAIASNAVYSIIFSARNTNLLSPSTLASSIVHEAVHVKYGAHHVICDHGQVKSKESCDQELGDALSENAGAYTWQALFLNEYARSNADKALRKSARSMLKAIIENQINAPPKYGPDGVTPLKKYYGIE